MSHPIRQEEMHSERAVGQAWAAVKVERDGERLTVASDSIQVLKGDTRLVPLPDRFRVVDSKGRSVKPSVAFYITTETFDPFHLLTDGLPPGK